MSTKIDLCYRLQNVGLGLWMYFYRTMLCRARLWDRMSSVCPSVRDVEVWFSHRLEYFENTFTAR